MKKLLTVATVKRRIAEIAAIAHDDEGAHSAEDRLWHEVLTAIASGTCEDPAGCAKAALKSTDIEFSRWCA